MVNYDYVLKNEKTVKSSRKDACFSIIYRSIEKYSRISILILPNGSQKSHYANKNKGKYDNSYSNDGFPINILKKHDTQNETGIERWAEFLGSFIPNTSFMLDYDEVTSKNICKQDVRISEFRIEDTIERPISSLLKQIWINGVRYSWEEDGPKIVDFCLHYWQPEMKPYEAFQIFLLSHDLIFYTAHACNAKNPNFYDEKMYNNLLLEKHDAKKGTDILSKGPQEIDKKTYEVIQSKHGEAVNKAHSCITKNIEPIKLEEILALWK